MQKIKIVHESDSKAVTVNHSVLWEAEWEEHSARKMKNQTFDAFLVLEDWYGASKAWISPRAGVVPTLIDAKHLKLIAAEGHVTHLEHLCPAVRSSIGKAPFVEMWKGICGKLGFKPHPDLKFTARAVGRKSVDKFYLTMKISEKARNVIGL